MQRAPRRSRTGEGRHPSSFSLRHTDHLGSTGYTTGASGNLLQHDEYFPGGEVWFEEVANGNTAQNRMAYLFNAKELDETGLYYYGARYYNPRSGVWVSPDPILDQYMRGGPNGGVFTPGNLGLYTYTWNNPVALRDPDGRFIDAIADVGFTLFDVGKLVYDEARGESGNRAVNLAAIGLDAAAILVPFVTGAGLAARLGAHAAEGLRAAEGAGHAAEAVRAAENVGEAGKAAEQAAELTHVVEPAAAAEHGGAAAAEGGAKRGIYEFPDQMAAGTPYVGQSGNIPKRLGQHKAAGRLTPGTETTTAVEGGKTAREVAEHSRIQEITAGVPARQSNAVANKVDPIGPNRQHLLKKE